MSNKSLETLFQAVAVVLLGVAAFFLWRGNFEGVFVASVLGSVSYFLSFRFQVKERLDAREAERAERELAEINMNRQLLRENDGLFENDLEEFEIGRTENEKWEVKNEEKSR